jgi:hypothetical protein
MVHKLLPHLRLNFLPFVAAQIQPYHSVAWSPSYCLVCFPAAAAAAAVSAAATVSAAAAAAVGRHIWYGPQCAVVPPEGQQSGAARPAGTCRHVGNMLLVTTGCCQRHSQQCAVVPPEGQQSGAARPAGTCGQRCRQIGTRDIEMFTWTQTTVRLGATRRREDCYCRVGINMQALWQA